MSTTRVTKGQRGFTLVEMVATITIMALIMVPLCTTMIQAMTAVPAAGDRSNNATQSELLATYFSRDVAQSQLAADALSGGFFGIEFNEALWYTRSATTNVLCPATAPAPGSPGSASPYNPMLRWASSWRDLTTAGSPTVTPAYGYVFTATPQSSLLAVSIVRWDRGQGDPPAAAVETLFTGYCRTGEANIDTLVGAAPYSTGNPSPNQLMTWTIALRDITGRARPKLVLSANIRATNGQ